MTIDMKPGLVLPGWCCPQCKVFNGEAKEERVDCRACAFRRESLPPEVVLEMLEIEAR